MNENGDFSHKIASLALGQSYLDLKLYQNLNVGCDVTMILLTRHKNGHEFQWFAIKGPQEHRMAPP